MNYTRLQKRLSLDEGVRAKPYRCTAGKLTIGIGRNLDDRGLSEQEIKYLFLNDVTLSVEECRRLLPTFNSLSDVRQEVLVNMMFNLGYSRLSQFKKFLAAIGREDWSDAAVQMLDSKWATQVGARATRLATAMRTGAFDE